MMLGMMSTESVDPSRGALYVTVVRRTLAMGLLACSAINAGCGAERPPVPQNRTVIMIDTSSTYRKRVGEAAAKAAALLQEIGKTKLQRWEKATDQISIITIDAMPDVLWEGTLKDLQAFDRQALTRRLAARTDYAGCTDVGAAFTQAVARLSGDPRSVHKYLLIFSDLIDEPPTTNSRTCRPPQRPSLPPAAMPWDSLRDVSTLAFWLPANQKLAWRRAIAEAGLDESFHLYAESDSQNVDIPVPARPKMVVSEADKAATRESIAGTASSVLTVLGAVALAALGLAILVGIGLALALRGRRRRRRSLAR
jgi:von Willebrand factor type A domain